MTIHYHGTPITPHEVFHHLRGRHFCVSFYRPDQVEMAHKAGQSVMLDNGAFSAWRKGLILSREYWQTYYAWCERWLICPTTWAVIPDVIDAGTQEQDALIGEWPAALRDCGVPVWHMDEPVGRLLRLVDNWPRVCIGSTAEYRRVRSPAWDERMDAVWDALAIGRRVTPTIHMLRGMQFVKPSCPWPFASLDSTDLGRNHNRLNVYGERKLWAVKQRADRWDASQCPARWTPRAAPISLFDGVAA